MKLVITHKKRKVRRFFILAAIAVMAFQLAFAASGAPQTPERRNVQTITLGIVSEIHRAQIQANFLEFARYLAEKLSSTPAFEGKVLMASTAFQLAKLIEQKKVDFYMESPYPTYLVNDVHGVAKLLLRRWKGGMAEYRSLIFTKNTGEVTRLENLQGKILVFEDPDSTSGHFLAKSFLRKKGFKFANKKRFDPYGSPTEIGYVFAYSQEKLVDMVLTKKAAAGAFSDDDYARLDGNKKSVIKVLAKTQRLPRNFVSIRYGLAPSLVNRLQKILLSMHESKQGRRILKKIDDTTKFDLLPEGEAGVRRRLAEIFRSAEKN